MFPLVDRARVLHFAKYLISGGIAALVHLAILESLVSSVRIEPVRASAISYIIALIVNFALQKFWSFRERDMSHVRIQATQFAITGLLNLCLNTALMYVFTYKIGLGYIVAQIIIIPIIAVGTYVVYKRIIFVDRDTRL